LVAVSATLLQVSAKSQIYLASLRGGQARLPPIQRGRGNYLASRLTGQEGMDNQWANLLVGQLLAGVLPVEPLKK